MCFGYWGISDCHTHEGLSRRLPRDDPADQPRPGDAVVVRLLVFLPLPGGGAMTEEDYAVWADVAAEEEQVIRAYISMVWARDWDEEPDYE